MGGGNDVIQCPFMCLKRSHFERENLLSLYKCCCFFFFSRHNHKCVALIRALHFKSPSLMALERPGALSLFSTFRRQVTATWAHLHLRAMQVVFQTDDKGTTTTALMNQVEFSLYVWWYKGCSRSPKMPWVESERMPDDCVISSFYHDCCHFQ